MRKKGWILLLVLLCVAFLMSCGKNKEPDEAKGELVRSEREENLSGTLSFFCFKKNLKEKSLVYMLKMSGMNNT